MKHYKQLGQEERYQIYAYHKSGMRNQAIANELGVHPSTIGRELKRNSGLKGYRPKQAHQKMLQRRQGVPKAQKLTEVMKSRIQEKLQEDWSPEQICGTFRKAGVEMVSHERIYQYIWEDKLSGGRWYQHLRGSHKKRKKRYGSHEKRGQIKDKVMIDERPLEVEEKKEMGHWEIDTVIGANHKGALVTLVERVSKFTLIGQVPHKQASLVSAKSIELLKPYQDWVHTITTDNGKEFAQHQTISQQLKTQVYFAHPYHSWERGLNENTNGLIRQYFPKGTSLKNVEKEKLDWVMNRLNHRPRKTLGFRTLYEVFQGGTPLINNNCTY